VNNQDAATVFLTQAREVWARASQNPYTAVNHLAVYVPDLAQAEQHVRQVFGVESMRLPEDDPAFSDQKYNVFWQGDCYWELIEPKEPLDPARFTAMMPMGYFGEVGYFVPDLDSEVERLTAQGWVVQSTSGGEGWKEAHIRPDPPSGLMIELIEFFGGN